MKTLILLTVLLYSPLCLAEDSHSNDNLSVTELANLRNELKVVEKTNNEKYSDLPNFEKFTQLFTNLSHLFTSGLSDKSSNKKLVNLPIDTPKFETSDYEIYSQKVYFKSALLQQKNLRKNTVRFKRIHNVQNDFASALQYDL